MGYAFLRVRDRMRIVVHRIDDPLRALPVMWHFHDTEEHRIAHVDVARPHVDLSAQYVSAFLELAFAHAFKELKVLFDRPVPKRTWFAGLGQCSSILPNFVGAQTIN